MNRARADQHHQGADRLLEILEAGRDLSRHVSHCIETTLNELAEFAVQIRTHHEHATQAAEKAIEHARLAGECLIQAKARIRQGKWLPWLQTNCQVSERTAQVYMRLARELPKLDGPKAQRVADLPLRQAMAVLATPRSPDETRAALPAPAGPVCADLELRDGAITKLTIEQSADADLPRSDQKRLVDADDPEAVFAEAKRLRAGRIAAKHEVKIVRPLPEGLYNCIYADPPWRFGDGTTDPSRAIERQYPTLSLDEIKALPVAGMAAKDCILFLWTTAPLLRESLEVLAAWAFTYKSCAVWDKQRIGMGHYFRIDFELLLIATCGSPGTPPDSLLQPGIYREKRGKHSVKPEWFRKTIEAYYPSAKRIELFARKASPGWAVWGDETESAAEAGMT